MKLLRWIAGTIIALGISAFAVFNLAPVTITWSPLHAPATLPASVFGLGMMGLGFILGALAAWIAGGQTRRERRRQRKTIKTLETALEAAHKAARREDLPLPPPSSTRLPPG